MKQRIFILGFLLIASTLQAQDSLSVKKDTITRLGEVVIHAYAHDRPLREVPAAVGFVDLKSLDRFNNNSLLSAANAIPGVRMEERSPGSYRFAIRGSSLRSPFGIRNVKMYWNGLPLTDGGGNTYLNLIDNSALASAEIIKGPGGSLYGAGTGGVVLLSSPVSERRTGEVSVSAGSYGLLRYQGRGQFGTAKFKALVNFSRQQSEGYRQQTSMRRSSINSDLRFSLTERSTLSASLFYTDLYYETPGGLTKAQFVADPRQARPSGPTPGAVAQQAAISNKTFYGGIVYDYQWNEHWTTRIGAYGSVTDFTNPALRNYELRKEDNVGGRTETNYKYEGKDWKLRVTAGAEYQHFYSPLSDYGNVLGRRDTLQTSDKLYSDIGLVFGQVQLDLPKDIFVTLGGSTTFLNYELSRRYPEPLVDQKRKFDPVLSPRLAALKKLSEAISIYASVSKGFSPPSLAEVRPSTGNFNGTLRPEQGVSYEAGVRGGLGQRFSFDVAIYDLELDQTIVVQQTNGADYFVNSGSTTQKGVEVYVSCFLLPRDNVVSLRLWNSYSANNYRFNKYVQNAQDFSHHVLTGVSPNVMTSGLDLKWNDKFYANITTNYVDKIPLNDGNTEFASSYLIVGLKIGYTTTLKRGPGFNLFAGIDNATDATYSLGNDLNAAGARYYNAAPGRNYYAGIKVSF